MTLPSPAECPWSKVCLIQTDRGPMAVYVERDQYGDYPYLAGDGVYIAKYDLDPYEGLASPLLASTPKELRPSWDDLLTPGPCCIWIGPDYPMPPVAPVELEASAVFLLAGLAVLAIFKRWRA